MRAGSESAFIAAERDTALDSVIGSRVNSRAMEIRDQLRRDMLGQAVDLAQTEAQRDFGFTRRRGGAEAQR